MLVKSAEVKITKANKQDIQTLMPFVTSYHDFEVIRISTKLRQQSVLHLLENPPQGSIWIIEVSKIAVGYIILCVGYSIEFCGYDAFIDEFYVEQAFRGKGIGSIVLELVKQESKKLGIRALHLEVDRNNIAARMLYIKAEFKEREKYVIMTVDLQNDSY